MVVLCPPASAWQAISTTPSAQASLERLIGLLDAAGSRDTNRNLLSAAQEVFRTLGTELFATSTSPRSRRHDRAESSHRIESLSRSRDMRIPVPHLIACYHEKFGTLYTPTPSHAWPLRDGSGSSELGSTGLPPLGLFLACYGRRPNRSAPSERISPSSSSRGSRGLREESGH